MRNLYPYSSRKQYEFKVWRSVSLLLIFCLVVAFLGHQVKSFENRTAEINSLKQLVVEKDNQIKQLTKENTSLKSQLRAASVKPVSPTLSEAGFNTLVSLLFPKQAGDRYRELIAACENPERDPKRININKDGSIDLGVSQINERYHASRVREIFNEDFWSAMSDSVKNMVYAALIYKEQGNFSAWSCNKLVFKR